MLTENFILKFIYLCVTFTESSSFIGFEVYKTSQPFDEAWTCFIQYNKKKKKTCKQWLFTYDIFSTDVLAWLPTKSC